MMTLRPVHAFGLPAISSTQVERWVRMCRKHLGFIKIYDLQITLEPSFIWSSFAKMPKASGKKELRALCQCKRVGFMQVRGERMVSESELLLIVEKISKIQQRFSPESNDIFLTAKDQREFSRLSKSAIDLIDQDIGRGNYFSLGLAFALNSGPQSCFGNPTYAQVGEAEALIRKAVQHLEQLAIEVKFPLSPSATSKPYVNHQRLTEIRAIAKEHWAAKKIAQLCDELNVAHANKCPLSIARLVSSVMNCISLISVSNSANNDNQLAIGNSSFTYLTAHVQTPSGDVRNAPSTNNLFSTQPDMDYQTKLDTSLADMLRLFEDKR